MYPESLKTSGAKKGSKFKNPMLILGMKLFGIRFKSNGFIEV